MFLFQTDNSTVAQNVQMLTYLDCFGNYLKIFGNIFMEYLFLGKVLNSLWHNLCAFGQIFIAENGQYWKHNMVIWSH